MKNTSPCGQCARVDCPPVDTAVEVVDQPFDAESVGDSEDADLVPLQSGEDWVAQLDDDLSRPASQSGETFRITVLQLQDTTCITLQMDLGKHIAFYRLELAQLWRCPVMWCTAWKGTAPSTVTRDQWADMLMPSISRVAIDTQLFSRIGSPLCH